MKIISLPPPLLGLEQAVKVSKWSRGLETTLPCKIHAKSVKLKLVFKIAILKEKKSCCLGLETDCTVYYM